MIFDNAIPFQELPESDSDLKAFLNYNPPHSKYTAQQKLPCRPPTETDRGGWRGYDRVYTKYFKDLKDAKLNLLEIGIYDGYGLLAWHRYFTNSRIHGIDINFSKRSLFHLMEIESLYPSFKPTRKYYFDTTKEEDWTTLYGKQFDIIIDDGGHHPDTQRATLANAFKYCKPGGLYFIEDIGHRYGREPLQKLSDELEALSDQYESIEIYSHENEGLHFLFKEPILTEYIVCIRKK